MNLVAAQNTPDVGGSEVMARRVRKATGVFDVPILGTRNDRAKRIVFPEGADRRYRETFLWGVVVRYTGQWVRCGRRLAGVLSEISVELRSATAYYCNPRSREETHTEKVVKQR